MTTHTTLDVLVDNAMNDAIRSIQDALNVTTGDHAGAYFSGEEGDKLRQILRDYATSEGATEKSTTPHTPFHSLRIRDRVEFVQDVERYPHFIARRGFTGYVSRITHQTDGSVNILEVKCDQHLPDCEEWDNSVVWVMPEDDADAEALARV